MFDQHLLNTIMINLKLNTQHVSIQENHFTLQGCLVIMPNKNRREKCQAAESVSHGGMKNVNRKCKGLLPQ